LRCAAKWCKKNNAKLLSAGKPRAVCWDERPGVVVDTDACYEKDAKDLVCRLGGVLVDGRTDEEFFFSVSLDAEQRALLGELNKKQINQSFLKLRLFLRCLHT
jgi:hypothetical protein